MARVLVIGGRGYYGAKVVEALRKLDGVAVSVGGRSVSDDPAEGAVRVDLRDASTFEALRGFDCVVNASDSVNAPPDEAARFCLAQGLVWMDMGADPATTERLLALDDTGATGAVVVGVGIFPGLSTALANAVARDADGKLAFQLDLGVRLSPFSGAGDGNCALMTHMLTLPSVWYEEGARKLGAPVGPAESLPFSLGGYCDAPRIALPDGPLLHRVTQVPSVATHLALIPGVLRHNFSIIAKSLAVVGPLRGMMLDLVGWSLRVLRAGMFRNRATSVELTAVANRGSASERVAQLTFYDGQVGTALGVAAAVAALLQRAGADERPVGVVAGARLLDLEREVLPFLARHLDAADWIFETAPAKLLTSTQSPSQDTPSGTTPDA